jgi:hypothetical protein
VSQAQECEDHHENTSMVRFVAGGFQLSNRVCTQGTIEVRDGIAIMQGQCETHPGDNYNNPEIDEIVQLRNNNWHLTVSGQTNIKIDAPIMKEYIKCR